MRCYLCGKRTNKVVTKELRNGERRKVYYCGACELGMLDDERSDNELMKFYNSEYRKKFKPNLSKGTDPGELFNIYSEFQSKRIALVKKFLTKKMKLLEVGCSAGMFLYSIKRYVGEVAGIDYDSRSVRFASKKCRCRVFSEDITQTELKDEKFDIICMFQVLEHAKNPHDFLVKYRDYLKPGGIIYVEVPNIKDALIYAYELPDHYKFYFHAAHLSYFSAKSLGRLMKTAGFKGRIYYTQDYNILNHMHWLGVDAPQGDCISGLSLPKLPLRNNLEKNKARQLNDLIQKFDREYKKTLSKLGITSNLAFIGRKTK